MIELKYVSPKISIPNKVVIVGSSGSIKNKDLGKIIDSYDYVVRFNRAPIDGYESICGSRTDLRVVNNHVIMNNDISKNDGGYSGQDKDFIRKLRNTNILYIGPNLNAWMVRHRNVDPSNNMYLYDYSTMESIKRDLGSNFPRNMTVGATFVCICVLSGIKPTLIGFDLSDKIDRTHYWENRPPKGDNVSHNINGEMQLLKRLINEKKINLIKNKDDII